MSKKDRQFWESTAMNNATFMQYYDRLTELSIAMFEWKNLPETIDQRFLELALFSDGAVVFFEDEVLGYLTLQCAMSGNFDVYRIPQNRRAYSVNGYNKPLDGNDSVIIWNNMLHKNSKLDVTMFAKRLANIDRIIDVNVMAQKTPILITCPESQQLTLKNMYNKYDGNVPMIMGDKQLDTKGFTALSTEAPYVSDKLYQLKTQLWNEALTYLGISNVNVQKKERLITDEVMRNQGGTIASRYSRLESRRQACYEINKKFGLDIWCDYREDYQSIDPTNDTINGEPNTDGEGGVVGE